MFLILETVGAQLTIVKSDLTTTTVSPSQYLQTDMTKCVIKLITLSSLPIETYALKTYKVALELGNVHF